MYFVFLKGILDTFSNVTDYFILHIKITLTLHLFSKNTFINKLQNKIHLFVIDLGFLTF